MTWALSLLPLDTLTPNWKQRRSPPKKEENFAGPCPGPPLWWHKLPPLLLLLLLLLLPLRLLLLLLLLLLRLLLLLGQSMHLKAKFIQARIRDVGLLRTTFQWTPSSHRLLVAQLTSNGKYLTMSHHLPRSPGKHALTRRSSWIALRGTGHVATWNACG